MSTLTSLSRAELNININFSIDNPFKQLIKEKFPSRVEPDNDINSFLVEKPCEEFSETKQQVEKIRSLHKVEK